MAAFAQQPPALYWIVHPVIVVERARIHTGEEDAVGYTLEFGEQSFGEGREPPVEPNHQHPAGRKGFSERLDFLLADCEGFLHEYRLAGLERRYAIAACVEWRWRSCGVDRLVTDDCLCGLGRPLEAEPATASAAESPASDATATRLTPRSGSAGMSVPLAKAPTPIRPSRTSFLAAGRRDSCGRRGVASSAS